ncbi:MarR family winged helix-turn-helix transcriptional regulator [Actinophytocola sp. NPDC049390]|uniref:MarR family winged helix-turn-helix transcriptional regulator n=1 Tax=Actinophytocola sp. NPDC049390 TaxID=3363894 RepID=UPI00379693D8
MAPEAIARLALAKRVSRLSLVFEQAMKPALSDLGLTYAEFDVLAALLRAGGRLRLSELAKSLYLTSGGTSNALQRLSAAGHVAREQNESDARSRWVHLTEKGTRLTEKPWLCRWKSTNASWPRSRRTPSGQRRKPYARSPPAPAADLARPAGVRGVWWCGAWRRTPG